MLQSAIINAIVIIVTNKPVVEYTFAPNNKLNVFEEFANKALPNNEYNDIWLKG